MVLAITLIWAALAVAAIALEIFTAIYKGGANTLSNNIWRYITGVGPSPLPAWVRVVNRIVIGAFLLWLFVHFLFGWLSP